MLYVARHCCIEARNVILISARHQCHIVMKIDQRPEKDYLAVKIEHVGCIDPYMLEGALILKGDDGREFPIRAFSGEVAKYIAAFVAGEGRGMPTIYKMLEDICEQSELVLVKVKVYDSGDVLRANLYFTGKRDVILRNYRASDALALAAFYNIPILIKKDLLKETMPA